MSAEGGSRDALAQAVVRTLLAALLLLLGEVFWLEDRGLVAAPVRLLALLAQLTTVVATGEILIALLWSLARLLSSARAAGVFTLIMLAPLAVAAHSLFSGNAIREVAGVQLFKLAFVIAGLVAVRTIVGLHRGLRHGRWAGRRRALAVACVAACWLASWVDTHVQVGLYPAFHLLLGAGAVLAAVTSARALQLGGRLSVSKGVAAVGAVLVFASVGATWFAWATPPMVAVAAYSDGLAPKLRQVVVAATSGQREPAMALAADSRHMPRPPDAPADANRLLSVDRLGQLPWDWPGGQGEVAGDLEAGPLDGVQARRVVFPAGDDAILQQAVPRDDSDSEWLASVWVRAADGETSGRGLRLVLGDGDAYRVESAPVLPGTAWTRVSLGPVHVVPPEMPGQFLLPADSFRHDTGFSWTAVLPDAWRGLASDVDSGQRSPLVLLEDGEPAPRSNALHSVIREEGQGAYSHWQDRLYFSSSDGTDPRHNGRRYELILRDEDRPPRGAGNTLFQVVADDGVEPAAYLLADPRLERLGGPDEGASLGGAIVPSGGWGSEFAFVPTRTPEAAAVRASTRNVVVVLMDALRADHVGQLHEGESLTPHIDALAAESVRFSTVYSPSDHTGRSVPSLMTSLPLGVTNGAADNAVPLPTWLSLLREGGYRTFHVGSNYVFRKYKHVRLPPVYGAEEHGTLDSKAPGLEREVLEFVGRDDDDRPFAVFAHWSDAHVHRSKTMAADYRDGVREADARLGRLVAGLKDAGVWHETAVVVTSDHGYALGEDRRYLTSQGVDEQSVRVPLVLRLPGDVAGGRVVDTPISSHGLFGTLLDVMLPEARVVTWSSGVLDLALRPDEHEPWAVHSSTGWAHMLRLGPDKLVVDESQDTQLLFDMTRDPEEQDPVYGGDRLVELRGVLDEARAREVRLLRALVAHTDGLPEHVLACLIDDELDLVAVREVLEGFWQLDVNTRRFVLRTLYQRGFDAIRFDLERLARNGWSDDDQILLVLRAWAGSRPAARALEARLPELSAEGMRWLLELFPDLPDSAVEPLAPLLLAELERLHGQQPLIGSDDERRLVLLAYGLAETLRTDAPGAVQQALVGRFNAWSSTTGPGPYFATLRTRKFMRRDLLTALRRTMHEDDLDVLSDIVLNRDVAIAVPEICLRLDSERSRAYLLDLIRRWDVPGDERGAALSYMLPTLRRFEDEAFREEANRIIQSNYPLVWQLQ